MLLVYGGTAAPDSPAHRTGGVPLAPARFDWPGCRACGGNLQFLAHLPLDADTGLTLSVFMCANEPGLCEEWDAAAGANRAYLFSGELSPAAVPAEGETQLGAVTALRLVPEEERSGVSEEEYLGAFGGEPDWLQGDETPDCPTCAAPMGFEALLEQGYAYETEANFGGGVGYAFSCRPCGEAAFLWQC